MRAGDSLGQHEQANGNCDEQNAAEPPEKLQIVRDHVSSL
jgi:hypothetical protein